MRTLVGLALVVVLAGCFSAQVDLTLNPDGTASGTARFGFARSAFADADSAPDATIGDRQDQLLADLVADAPPGMTCSPMATEELVGAACELEAVAAEALSTIDTLGQDIAVARVGEELRVSGNLDLTDLPADAPDAAADPFDVRVSVTFPGPVQSQVGGQIDGRTVTWQIDPGGVTELHAVGSAVPASTGGPFPVPLLAGAALALALAALGVALLVRARTSS